MARLRLAFLGTPDFALPTLDALIAAGHEIACVYTQPARPAGRGMKARPAPVAAAALARGIAVRSPRTLRDAAEQAAFAALSLDAAVVVAYGLILPRPILAAPRLGCINVHASLLPRWRGAAPIQRALLAGDAETGVTIMQMDEGLDTGPMLLTERLPIGPQMTAGDLHDRLAALGGRMIVPALDGLATGTLKPRPQPEAGVTYAKKIDRAETGIDWRRPAAELERLVRAFAPVPGAWFLHAGTRIRVLKAELVEGQSAEPGTVLDGHLGIACGAGALRLVRLQREGRSAMDADAFLRGMALPPGTRLTLPGQA
ncbi:MAG: methionyl-tRNA formyltransferase [Alphaproteobacteria bacterium]